MMNIVSVTVELLRAGPRHNQLLSPLTQYLGVCGDREAVTISLPYEHADFERDLAELNYEIKTVDSAGVRSIDAADRRSSLMHRLGRDMARILGAIPGLGGALSDDVDDDVLINLRIVMSASELALLPFELSKMPTVVGGVADTWLALQARTPVCITRHIRSIASERISWPTKKIRILFAAGPDVPVKEHEEALADVLQPWWLHGEQKDDRFPPLEVLPDATHEALRQACFRAAEEGAPFTHVHILAHGAALDDSDRHAPIGIEFFDEVVSGDRLAMSLTPMTREGIHRPTVVTLATCYGGSERNVMKPASSVAHKLHESSIPLVVASQFPLSQAGSVPFVRHFYEGQLWADHPLESICDIRRRLYSRSGMDVHDWSSLVVYEALPPDLQSKLEELRYWQTRSATEKALERMEAELEGLAKMEPAEGGAAFEKLVQNVDEAVEQLPTSGPYASECAGLRAAASKRVGEAAILLANELAGKPDEALLALCRSRLDAALIEYRKAANFFLSSGSDTAYRKANLHWLLGQVLALRAFLGRPLDKELWSAARLAADVDLDRPNSGERAWANVSLCELHLLKLSEDGLAPTVRKGIADEARQYVRRMIALEGYESEQAKSTRRQLQRYVMTWGNVEFADVIAKLGLPPRDHWHEDDGLVPAARALIDEIRPASSQTPKRPSTSEKSETPKRPASSPSSVKQLQSTRTSSEGSSIFTIEMLPARNGDCLWIEYGDAKRPHRILIDCGARTAADALKQRLAPIVGKDKPAFELFVLTHIDSDHIDGVQNLFEDEKFAKEFEDIWFNGWKQVQGFLSVRQGEDFTKLLEDPERNLPWNRKVGVDAEGVPLPLVVPEDGPHPFFSLPGGMRLTLLSPGTHELNRMGREWQTVLEDIQPEKAMLGGRRRRPPAIEDFDAFDLDALANKKSGPDRSPANGSSIALLAEYEGRTALLTGDAHASVLTSSIRALQRQRGLEGEPLALDALKLSHHGSANATSRALLKVVQCPRYLVSSDGSQFYHPDREAIARVILGGGDVPTLYFNYRSELNQLWDNGTLKQKYKYRAVFPNEGDEGLLVDMNADF